MDKTLIRCLQIILEHQFNERHFNNSHYQDLFLVSQFKTPTQAPCLQSPRMKDNKAHNYATILRRYSARFTQITFHCAYIAFKETGICAAELYIKFTLFSECKALSLPYYKL